MPIMLSKIHVFIKADVDNQKQYITLTNCKNNIHTVPRIMIYSQQIGEDRTFCLPFKTMTWYFALRISLSGG